MYLFKVPTIASNGQPSRLLVSIIFLTFVCIILSLTPISESAAIGAAGSGDRGLLNRSEPARKRRPSRKRPAKSSPGRRRPQMKKVRRRSTTPFPKSTTTRMQSAKDSRLTAIAHQERLYRRVIYDEQLTRPDMTEIPINVTVRIMLIKIQELVEKNELVETTVRIQIGWRDRRLKWNKSEFGGIQEILLPSSSVWIPDLTIINSVGDVYSVVRDTRFEIKVLDNGQVWWHPTGVLRTFCKLHLSYFPFDQQKCPIIVESPTFDSRFLTLMLRSSRDPVDLRMYVKSETWHLEKAFGTSQNIQAGVSTYFSRIEFWIVLDRARLYHSINFILPCFILSAIQTVFLFLPVTHPQRVGSTTVTMLSVMVFQSMVVAQLPKTSESVPLLSIYIDLVILISATSVCASVFTAMCQFNYDQFLPIPKWLQTISKCFCRRKSVKNKAESSIESPIHQAIINCEESTSPGQTSLQKQEPLPKQRRESCQQPKRHPSEPMVRPSVRATHSFKYKLTRLSTSSEHLSPSNKELTVQHGVSAPLQELSDEDNEECQNTFIRMPAPRDSHNPLLSRRPTSSWDDETNVSQLPVRVTNRQTDEASNAPQNKGFLTWLDILMCINRVLNMACALAVTLGPIVIFGIIPNVIEHEDYPKPLGLNFTLLEKAKRLPKPSS